MVKLFPEQVAVFTGIWKHVQKAMDRLNNRPRKTLGYKTPNEVFFQVFAKQAA